MKIFLKGFCIGLLCLSLLGLLWFLVLQPGLTNGAVPAGQHHDLRAGLLDPLENTQLMSGVGNQEKGLHGGHCIGWSCGECGVPKISA